MDPADAYVNLYDLLRLVDASVLSDWSDSEQVREIADQVRLDVERDGVLSGQLLPDPLIESPGVFGVLLGLDLALLHASKEMDSLAFTPLDRLRTRLTITGRLNDETSGFLVFKRASSLRPTEDPEHLDDFLHLIRVSPYESADLHIQFVPELYDLPDMEAIADTEELGAPPPLTIAQLPFLAEPEDVEWATIDARGTFYSTAPASARLLPHLGDALTALDESGAVLGVLSEACLDDALLGKWCELLESTPRPEGGLLTWIVLGSGPVTAAGPPLQSLRPPNRAVLVHRSGRARLLLTQDKQTGFTFTVDKQHEYRVDLGDVKRDEFIPHVHQLNLLESRLGRFGVQICEDLGRPERHQSVVSAGVTHLVVPVLAASMWNQGWQARAGETLGVRGGIKVAVSNSLAIHRFFNEMPSPTLLVVSGPHGTQDHYLRSEEMVRVYSNVNGKTMEAREDALRPRTAEW
ncbi:hypothetical protein [Kibdelosporangium phytohabitans]|uniref:Uncharacterized protein n=1 Tax=Kibdelosporangium phytohabitans TaxID=860235 RepID=A0A0N9I327_9PSEU|nr:hypothetical protein [Kibdelosporangium phytohabitans]ALG08642.1 hypothetical protein AOZ06_18500 [Kibdelosporangium phytohabitans]MBE1470260.1 hypothetical protein [Kibdelosporangium phytohabitans]